MFKVGDKVRRTAQNYWWINFCKKYRIPKDGIFTVQNIGGGYISLKEVARPHKSDAGYFELVKSKQRKFI